jgi:hypothetical protein
LNRDGPPLDYGCPICSGTWDIPRKNTTIFIGFLFPFQFKDPASLIESNPAVKKPQAHSSCKLHFCFMQI